MKATESKTTSASRTFRSAEPFFNGSSADLQLKPAFESEDEARGPSADVHRKPAFESEDEGGGMLPDVHRKAAFESDEEGAGPPVQMKKMGAGPRSDSGAALFKTSGDGGFFSDGGKPFFSVSTLQPKLKIGHPNDRFEREADEAADRVVEQTSRVHAPPPPVQRQDDESGMNALADPEAPVIQQRAGDGDASGSMGDAGSDVESRLNSTKGQGRPLDEGTRTKMESSFGADFSGVNVHTGSDAIRLSNQLGAEAFTHGNDIYFNERKYSPESPKGRHLLAHELTHTVQQGASVRRKSLSRTGGPRIQRGVISNLINRVLRHVPGWTLLTVILGKNPVTGDAVPRTATNILDGLLGLLPGGAVLANKLRETGALEEAGNWLGSEVDKLGITFSYIKGLISQAWDELSVWNSWSANLAIVKRIFGEPYRRIKTFVGNIAGKIKEFVFRGALKLVGAPVDTIMGILNKGADVLGRIISDPIGFFQRLGSAVGGGIRKFVGKIKQYLVGGLIDWLTGAMSGLPITLPTKFDVKGIIHLVLQILGLTWENIRGKLVKRLGDKVMSTVEKGIEIVQKLRTEGPMALWDMIKEKAGEIKQQVMDGIRNWVVTQVVKQAVVKLLSFINPAGALVQAAIGLYNLVMFFYENMSRIIDFVRSIFNSIGEIARGAVAKASTFIETAMGRAIPIILNFLARLIGLSGIGKAVSNIIKKIRKPIDKVVDKAIDFVVKKAKSLLKKAKKAGKKVKKKALAILQWWKIKKAFTAKDGKKHSLSFKGKGKPAKLVVASNPLDLKPFLDEIKGRVKGEDKARHAAAVALLSEISSTVESKFPEVSRDRKNLTEARAKKETDNLAKDLATLSGYMEYLVKYRSAEGEFGTKENPFLIKWHKPAISDSSAYPNISVLVQDKSGIAKDMTMSATNIEQVKMYRAHPDVRSAVLRLARYQLKNLMSDAENAGASQGLIVKLTALREGALLVEEIWSNPGPAPKKKPNVLGSGKATLDELKAFFQQAGKKVDLVETAIATLDELRNADGAPDEVNVVLGVDPMFRPRKGTLIGPKRKSPRRGMERKFKQTLKVLNYDMAAKGEPPEHIIDLSLGGPDNFHNLWPMSPSARNASPQQLIDLTTGKQVQSRGENVKGVSDPHFPKGTFFLIEGFES